jgi:transmembrane sensor
MTQTLFLELLAKKLSGEATPAEIEQLDELMRKHPEWMFSAQHITDLWNLKEPLNPEISEDAYQQHLLRMQEKGLPVPGTELPAEPLRPRKAGRILLPLALLTILVISLYMLWPKGETDTRQAQVSEVQTKAGSRTRLVLPDSSTVWLNAGSKLSYPEGFGVKTRELTLSGEAFFDVRKSNIPFIINTPSVRISVLGTAFNVKSYPNEKTTETSIVRGKVEVSLNNSPGKKFILERDEKLVVPNVTRENLQTTPGKKEPVILLGKLTHLEDSSIMETSWVENKLVFMDESFAEVAKKMERWYNVKIEIRDARIALARLTGTFENETVTQALEALQITMPFRFTTEKNQIIITP